MTVHIACSTHNGSRFVGEFVESLQRQTHADWRLWLRDNGSADNTTAVLDSICATEPRVAVVDRGSEPVGVVSAYARLLGLLPSDAPYVILADQDDVWLPEKLEVTLAAMRGAEREAPGPVLVHTDLTVADAGLNPIATSFWAHNRVNPALTELRQIVVRNVVTAGTAMMNRPLRELVRAIPAEAAMHDWWIALVAAAFGRIVVVPRSTVLYRQHGANVIGAHRPYSALSPREMVVAAPHLGHRTRRMRANLAAAARQARAFLERFGDRLPAADREFLAAYARIPERGYLARRADLLRLHILPGNSLLQNLGILLRA